MNRPRSVDRECGSASLRYINVSKGSIGRRNGMLISVMTPPRLGSLLISHGPLDGQSATCRTGVPCSGRSRGRRPPWRSAHRLEPGGTLRMTDTDPILVREQKGGVLVLRLNRPEARNAFNPELMGDLGQAL